MCFFPFQTQRSPLERAPKCRNVLSRSDCSCSVSSWSGSFTWYRPRHLVVIAPVIATAAPVPGSVLLIPLAPLVPLVGTTMTRMSHCCRRSPANRVRSPRTSRSLAWWPARNQHLSPGTTGQQRMAGMSSHLCHPWGDCGVKLLRGNTVDSLSIFNVYSIVEIVPFLCFSKIEPSHRYKNWITVDWLKHGDRDLILQATWHFLNFDISGLGESIPLLCFLKYKCVKFSMQ